jgi:hypothetical protein
MKKKPELTNDQLWVMMATLIAFIEANYDDPWDYYREYEGGRTRQKALFRRIEAFRLDPDNEAAIVAAAPAAAQSLGRGATKQ